MLDARCWISSFSSSFLSALFDLGPGISEANGPIEDQSAGSRIRVHAEVTHTFELITRAGYRVGIIDTDIQSPGIHVLFQMTGSDLQRSLNDYLWSKCQIEDTACDVTARSIGNVPDTADRPRLYVTPSSLKTGEIA